MIFLQVAGLLLAGALTYRIRGGLLEPWHMPGTLAHVPFALIMGAAALTVGGSWAMAAAVVVATLAAEGLVGNFEAIDLGRHDGTYWQDADLLTLRGLLFMIGPGFAVDALSDGMGVVAIGAGGCMAFCYMAAWAMGPRPLGLRFGQAGDEIETAEVLTGMLLVAGLAMAVWGGVWVRHAIGTAGV